MIFYLVEDLCGFVLNGLDFNLVGRVLSLPVSQCLLKPLQDGNTLSNISYPIADDLQNKLISQLITYQLI